MAASEWDVVEEKPVSDWDVVSTAPVAAPAVRVKPGLPGTGWQVPVAPGARTSPTPPPEFNVGQKVEGAVQAALSVATGITNFLPGIAAGGLEALATGAGELTGRVTTMIDRQSRNVPKNAELPPLTSGEGVVANRLSKVTYQPPSQYGQQLLEQYVNPVMEQLPAVAGLAGVRHFGPEGGMAPALQAVSDVGRRAAEKTGDIVLPELSKTNLKHVQAATEAGIPVSPHQLAGNAGIGNRFLKLLGEGAEAVPLAGGASLNKARREGFSKRLSKLIDPNTDATVLDSDTFANLQDAAGARIGEIAARTDVPYETFGDLARAARHDTPDVQGVVASWAADLKTAADQNGGVVPGTTLRKLRTEIQTQERAARGAKGDLANALDRVVKQLDDALAEHAPEGDMPALLAARKSYAISKTLQPLLSRFPNGDFPPAALKSVVTNTLAKKNRMARGDAGEVGDYARLGQEILKEMPSSLTAERGMVYRAGQLIAGAGAANVSLPATAGIWAGSGLYNLAGPRFVKWLAERQAKREAPVPKGPEVPPTMGEGFEGIPQPRGGRPPPPTLAGEELTPNWETTPGAGGAPPPAGIEPTGLVRAVGEPTATTGSPTDMRTRGGQQIPPVPGRPGLPEAMVTGAPAEVSPNAPTNAAMLTPEAVLARRQQAQAQTEAAAAQERTQPVPAGKATEITPQVIEPAKAPPEPAPEPLPVGETKVTPIGAMDERLLEIERLKAEAPSDTVRETLDERAKAIVKEIKAKEDAVQKKVDAADLRKTAEDIADPDTKKALLEKADKLDPPPKEEKPNATEQVTKQASVQQERGGGNEGGKAAEASTGDRVQREAQGKPTTEGKVNEGTETAPVTSGKGVEAPANEAKPDSNAKAKGGGDGAPAGGQGAETGQAEVAGVPPIVKEMIGAVQKSTAELRNRITNVKYGSAERNEITFDFDGKPHVGTLKGRNADLVLSGKNTQGDRAVALRTLLDGDAKPVEAKAEPVHVEPSKPAAPPAPKRLSSREWVEEGLTPEQKLAQKVDLEAKDLARTIAEEVKNEKFGPGELRAAVREWANKSKVPADDLRQAVIKQLDTFGLSKKHREAIRAQLDLTKATKPPKAEPPSGEQLSITGLPKIDESFMSEQKRVQDALLPPPSEPGLAGVRAALQKGADEGTLNKDGVALALWLLDRNPNLAKGLEGKAGLTLEGRHPEIDTIGAEGSYTPALQLIKLFEYFDKPETAAHEIFHHIERMMPTEMRNGIRREWRAALDRVIAENEKTNPEVAAALLRARAAVKFGNRQAYETVIKSFDNGTLNAKDHYALVNPSEYWAVNASRILNERFTGRGSWRAEARQWINELIEHIKSTLGLRSDAPILKALDAILNPEVTTGKQTSTRQLDQTPRRN